MSPFLEQWLTYSKYSFATIHNWKGKSTREGREKKEEGKEGKSWTKEGREEVGWKQRGREGGKYCYFSKASTTIKYNLKVYVLYKYTVTLNH